MTAVGELHADEAAELGPLLARTAAIVDELVQPEQVYVGLWSHAGRTRVHIHFVVQPATTEAIEAIGAYGPVLVAGMFEQGELPDPAAVEALSISPGRVRFRVSASLASGAVMPAPFATTEVGGSGPRPAVRGALRWVRPRCGSCPDFLGFRLTRGRCPVNYKHVIRVGSRGSGRVV